MTLTTLLWQAAYLFGFLMVLRNEETMKIEFDGIDMIPGERVYHSLTLSFYRFITNIYQGSTLTFAYTHASSRKLVFYMDGDCGLTIETPRSALCELSFSWHTYMVIQSLSMGHFFYVSIGMARSCIVHQWYVTCNLNRLTYSYSFMSFSLQTTGVLSRFLMKDLQELGYKTWALYGTHSFRRGGAQYRLKDKGWTAAMVAGWGGWSQTEAVTMFRYFYSPIDNHDHMNEYDRNTSKRVCF